MPSNAHGEFGGESVKLVGPPALRSVNGLRVRVIGTQAHDRKWPGLVSVTAFTVIGLKALPVIDGMLREDAGAVYVETPDGERHVLVDPPPDLRARIGARVWVAGPLDHEPVAYGAIEWRAILT